MNAHSVLAPSSAASWLECSGAPLMIAGLPQPETEDSREGTASHNIGQDIIEHGLRAFSRTASDYVGGVDLNGVVYDNEMYEAADLYAQVVLQRAREHGVFGGPSIGIEERLEIPRIHALCYGTPDAYVYNIRTNVLDVLDYKYGRLFVDEYENWQLISYYAGILDKLKLNDLPLTVRFTVVQPRAYNPRGSVRTWRVPATDLRAHINRLRQAAEKATTAAPSYSSGKHCKYCPGRHVCVAAIQSAQDAYQCVTSDTPANPTPVELGSLLSALKTARKHIEAMETGYQEQIEHLSRTGVNVPGWIMEPKKSPLKWTTPPSVVEQALSFGGQTIKKDAYYTPTQAIKELGIDEAVINAYSDRTPSGLKLIEDNDNKAKRIFSQ